MHITLILWISLLLNTAVASTDYEPTEDQIKTLVEGQVIWTRRWQGENFNRAIFLGRTRLRSGLEKLKLVRFAASAPHVVPSENQRNFRKYFPDARMRDKHGTAIVLQGRIDLSVNYVSPKSIRMPGDRVILPNKGMILLKEEISITLVNGARPFLNSYVINIGQIGSLEKGRMIFVWSNRMYGGLQQRHPFHFAIFLGLANPQHGSALLEMEIAQIVMNLPLPVPHEDRRDFDAYFPTTWWKEPNFVFDGQIDIRLHKVLLAQIRIPNEIVLLDSKGVKKLEDAMATAQLIESCLSSGHGRGRGRSSSGPANYHITSAEQFDESASKGGQTPVRSKFFGHCDPGQSKSEPANHHTNT